jgi:hypothetical protein
MDARPCLAPRLAATTPSGLPPGVSPHDRTLSQLGEEMAQAAHEIRDLHDPCVLCSRSRAHHAPYFRWDVRVTQRMVEMRFSPPENWKRVPGPRALLYYLPRDPELQAAQVPLPLCWLLGLSVLE